MEVEVVSVPSFPPDDKGEGDDDALKSSAPAALLLPLLLVVVRLGLSAGTSPLFNCAARARNASATSTLSNSALPKSATCRENGSDCVIVAM